MSLFRVRLLPAGHGDCILVEYGAPTAPHRVLVDGGTAGTAARLEKVLAAGKSARPLDLIVITHVDADHVAGMVAMVQGAFPAPAFDDCWFNGYRHLVPSALEPMGPVQGEVFSTWLVKRDGPWNKHFGGGPVVVPAGGELPRKTLPGGMVLTLLSPTAATLGALEPGWKAACREAGIDPAEKAREEPVLGLEPMGPLDVAALAATPFTEDESPANGSSIAFLAEYDGRAVLFGADAHPGVLAASIARLPGGTVTVDAFKLPHHGSKHNLSPALVALVDTRRYLVSTNGAYFKHPDREALARIVVGRRAGTELRFNASTPYTQAWHGESMEREWKYAAILPEDAAAGAVLDL